jgi:hypothetical protein
MVHGHHAASPLLLVATLLPPLQAQPKPKPKPSILEPQAAAAAGARARPRWGDGAGRGFPAVQNTSPDGKGKQTTLALEKPGWSIRLGFNSELSAQGPAGRCSVCSPTWGLLKKQIASLLDCSQGPWRRQLLSTVTE